MSSTELFVWAVVFHLVADWIFQNEWIAVNKTNLKHPALYIHGLIHFLFMLVVFPFWSAAIVAFMHMAIDTRIPVKAWQKHFKHTSEGPYAIPVAIWLDQVFHVVVLALVALVQ